MNTTYFCTEIVSAGITFFNDFDLTLSPQSFSEAISKVMALRSFCSTFKCFFRHMASINC